MITKRVAMEVCSHEAVIREAYKDSVGVWTWSVGLTNATGHNVERYINKPQSMRRCIEMFIWALERYADDVKQVVGDNLTEAQFAAALSFHYNTGAIRRASWVKHWKAGNIGRARSSFMAWNKPKEIIKRRKKEHDLFFDGKWSGDGTIIEYTRLTSRKTPVWGSATKRDISGILDELLEKHRVPDAEVTPPTPNSFWARLARRLRDR